MKELPEYINCNSKAITHCDFYMHALCPETCNYAEDVKGIGCGSMMVKPGKLEDAADNSTKVK